MNGLDYLKSKGLFLWINWILFMSLSILMIVMSVSGVFIFLIWCIWFIPLIAYWVLEYRKYQKYFSKLEASLNNLDQAYLICEVVEDPSFLEGQLFHEVLRIISKNMHEHVNEYKQLERDYREYIETWVHEIKTPIASAKLILENTNNDASQKVDFELRKVEMFINQVLYYARSQEVSQDYLVQEFSLRDLVYRVIRQNSREFIYHKVGIEMKELDGIVFSDIKSVEFILNQILLNAIKYTTKEGGKVVVETMNYDQSIVLKIQDEGVGISEKDLPRVFDKGFTGENGRLFGRSTGMGLYLCQKLCIKLRIGLKIESEVGIGSCVYLTFPKGKYMFLDD